MGNFFLIFIWIFSFTFLQAQEVDAPNESSQEKLEKEFQASLQEAAHTSNVDLIFVENLTHELEKNDLLILDNLQNAEFEKLGKDLDRYELIQKNERTLGRFKEGPSLKVAVLGNSSLPIEGVGFNREVLVQLLKQIKKQNPAAVFFTGNLIYSVEENSVGEGEEIQFSLVKDIFGKEISQVQGLFNPEQFKKKLNLFSEIVSQNLGDTPFYPLIGEQEAIAPAAIEIFQNHFHLDNALIIDNKQLVYSIALGNSLFITLSCDHLNQEVNEKIEKKILPQTLLWLEKTLKEEGAKYRFKFVLGCEPAFSTTATFGVYAGLDKNTKERNLFWNLLRLFEVKAYIAGNEVLFDRSYRYNVWQLISGGAGATSEYKLKDDTFYHYLLLTIPQGNIGESALQVFDLEGEKKDDVVLSGKSGAIFQLRISKSDEDD